MLLEMLLFMLFRRYTAFALIYKLIYTIYIQRDIQKKVRNMNIIKREKKSESILFRLTPTLKQQLQDVAEEEGVTVTDLLTHLVESGLGGEQPKEQVVEPPKKEKEQPKRYSDPKLSQLEKDLMEIQGSKAPQKKKPFKGVFSENGYHNN